MSDVKHSSTLGRIREVEADVERRIHEARRAARESIRQAERDSKHRLQAAEHEGQAEAKRRRELALQAPEAEAQALLATAQIRAAELIELTEAQLPELLDTWTNIVAPGLSKTSEEAT